MTLIRNVLQVRVPFGALREGDTILMETRRVVTRALRPHDNLVWVLGTDQGDIMVIGPDTLVVVESASAPDIARRIVDALEQFPIDVRIEVFRQFAAKGEEKKLPPPDVARDLILERPEQEDEGEDDECADGGGDAEDAECADGGEDEEGEVDVVDCPNCGAVLQIIDDDDEEEDEEDEEEDDVDVVDCPSCGAELVITDDDEDD